MRVASDCRPTLTAWHASQPRSSTSHPPQQQDTVHRELSPCTGKGARASAGPLRRVTRQAAGRARAQPPPPTALQSQPHTTRPPSTTTGRRKRGHPVVSNRPLHRTMQQRCHHASASARSQSWHMTISPEICSPQHPICVASRRIRHTTCFGLEPKIRTSSLRRNPDRMECTKHNIWIGGVRYAQEGSWAVKLTFISHVHVHHPWRTR